MRALVILNQNAGTLAAAFDGSIPVRVEKAFRAAGWEADVWALPGHLIGERLPKLLAAPAEVVVAGGGDGTISTVAGALAGGLRPLGVLPLGTLNHFARDLGIPLILEEALRTVTAGTARAIDVGEVNGRVFVNNSSLGFYPRVVQERDEQRVRLGRSKWLALVLACLTVFRRFPLVSIRLSIGAKVADYTTPLLFVGNNRYEPRLLTVRGRSSLGRGELCLYLVKGRGRFTMVRLTLRALFGLLEQSEDFEETCLPEFWVDSRRRQLSVAVDGEVVSLRPPLHYRTRPGALRVIVPAGPGT